MLGQGGRSQTSKGSLESLTKTDTHNLIYSIVIDLSFLNNRSISKLSILITVLYNDPIWLLVIEGLGILCLRSFDEMRL